MGGTEERKIEIPTCKITRETLQEIATILETEKEELEKMDNEASCWLTFEIQSKTKNIKADSTKSLMDSRIPKKLEELHLNLYYNSRKEEKDERHIWVWLYFNSWSDSQITVEGSDVNWVSGVSEKLKEVFEENKNSNYIFRKFPTLFPIVLGISLSLGLGVTFVALSYFPEIFEEDENPLWLTLMVVIATAVPFWVYLNWLFLPIEFENYQIQTKIKKITLSGLGTIIIGLIVAGLSKLLF